MPALAALPGAEVSAVATSNAESAARAAAAFGVRQGYGNLADLLATEPDLVVISVKAPAHENAALATIAAGRNFFLEWPMGSSLAQAEHIVARAKAAGVRGFVGLQGRASPTFLHAATLINDGYLGRLFSISVYGAFSYWSEPVATAYSANAAAGANVLTIPGGHGLDLMRLLGGEVTSLTGQTSHLRSRVMAADTGTPVPMTAPDQFAAVGTLESGAVFSAHFAGTAPFGETFRMALVGDRGELLIEGAGMPEIAPLRLSGTRTKGAPPQDIEVLQAVEVSIAPDAGPAQNVYLLWRQILGDLMHGTCSAPGLDEGLKTRRLIDAIAVSAGEGGSRVVL